MGAKGNEYKIRISKIMQELNEVNLDLLNFENEAEHFEEILSLDELLYCVETLTKRFKNDVKAVVYGATAHAMQASNVGVGLPVENPVPQVTYTYVEPVKPAFEEVPTVQETSTLSTPIQEASKPKEKEENPLGEDYYDNSGDRLEVYAKDFEEIFNELKKIGTFWGDPDEYYYVFNNMEKAQAEISEAKTQEEEIIAIGNWSPILSRLIKKYKEELADEEYISVDVMKRIRLINRTLRLFEQMDSGVTNPRESTIFVASGRIAQVCICKGLNGEYHQEYLRTLLDEEVLFKAQKEIAEARFVVKEYGKAVPVSDRKKLLDMDDEKMTDRILALLKIKPEQILAYSPTLCEGLLKDIGFVK